VKKLIAAAAVVVVVVVAWLSFGARGPKPVVHGLKERDANEILVVLAQKGIRGEKLEEQSGRVITWRVDVADVDVDEALRVLVANQLPRAAVSSWSSVYPDGNNSLIPTRSEERAKYAMALQGEIESKLMSLPGIVSAHVTIVQPERDLLHGNDVVTPSSASVAIVYNAADERGSKPQLAPNQSTDAEIPALVAAAVEGLKPENVHVTWARNTARPDAIAAGTVLGATTASVQRYGLALADKRSVARLDLYAALLALVSVLAVAVACGGFVRAIDLKKRLRAAEAKLAAAR
jgi:type III secretion system YscJ/HrcJ family lipoprotein